jgi:hypothetical protein
MNDAKHWRERAEEARVHAEAMTDPEAKRTMLGIAAEYERLAELAEERTEKRPDDPPTPSSVTRSSIGTAAT